MGFCDLQLSARFTHVYPFSVEPPNFPQKGLRFLGFMSLMDPPRPQVLDAVGKCRMAGIKVIMVTGDHPVLIFLRLKKNKTSDHEMFIIIIR